MYLTDDFIEKMREKYFSEKRWAEMSTGRIAILAIDLQRFFMELRFHAHLPSAYVLIEKLYDFYSIARDMNVPIIFTRHCHEGNIITKWWGDNMPCGHESTEIVGQLLNFASETVVKHTYDSFYATDLDDILRDMNVDTVIVTGVMTHLCCETTAREAFVRNFNVIFPIDGTITQNSKLHEGTLRALSHGFAITPTLDEVKKWMQRLE